ncbi:NADPH:quinone reductase [Natronococcus pandeyae]|uniref:NADPH:quinone reductase n=1 Tax=Natronococcus pandeyae TaxID=2055836 RepID=A0A8J8TR96_9EURY|nr:NADPH:quinone oxidoreductase family protein [Natronococcus pandeyae]TYL37342.1 NADPH:quinone reductase [Natronococcus pandeyae]
MKAIEARSYGESDELEAAEKPIPDVGDGEIRIKVEAAGINFADIMQRRGTYPGGPNAPFVPGAEAAGTIDAAGDDVDFAEGDRVVALTGGAGYAEYATANAKLTFPIPEGMTFVEAAGFPVQFLTAHSCLFGWGELEADETVLIQAAAGGVGTAAVQLATNAGAEVFGTASTREKLDLAEELGCDHPIKYTETDFRSVVDERTDGKGIDLVLESVGGDVFSRSLDALAHFGRLVTYGVASGVPAEVENKRLFFENQRVIGFHLGQALAHDPSTITRAIPELTEAFAADDLEVIIGETFSLEDAATAHQHIEDRESTGKVVLKP